MAENIDGLQIEISADANIAEKSLNRLADSLIKLQSSVGALGNGQFQNLAAGIRQLSDSMERFSGGVKTADFTRIATGLSKLSGVNVQGVSDASRAISTLTTNLSQIGSLAFDSQGIAKIANAIAQLGRKTVTQATANIPLLSMALSGLINEMNGIGTLNFDTKGLSELVAAISKLGGKTATTAASGNIKNLAIALKKMMVTLSTAPKVSQNLIQMTQALAQLASTGGRAGTATASLTRNFNALPSSVHKARSSFNGLAGAIGKFYATYWLLIRGMGQFKKAIDISSSLTEVQNVVDVSFGDMSNKMDEFADSALRLYGMSELTAKQIGSRFQAMGVAMGFAQDEMSDMSIRLTKLAGDLSSFYNISQEQVATKLQSIFTGETEPMRQLGLDLSFATVEAWALAHGIEADMQKMTQAEKTMLRYQYVLANTGAATDDFQRTIGSWANQLRLLTGNFEQLGSIVGGVLVNAFKPFIQALNSVMGAVISFAQVVSDALGAIFGWEYQTGGGVAQDLEFGAGAAEDIEEATGGAAKNAKELNRYIAAWHEVNNMTSNDGGSGGGSGGGGAGGAASGNADGGQWVQAESLWEKYTSDIDSLYELGAYIGEVLTKAMNDIDWDSVYESARNFGTGLASFLNGLISPELFGATGRTIAGALNTAIYAALSFGETFDWKDFGLSIATGINEFFRTFDFASLAQTINVWVQGIWKTLWTALSNIDWKGVFGGAFDFFRNLEIETIGIIVGAVAIKKIGKVIFGASIGKKIADSLTAVVSKSIIPAIAKVISGSAIGTAIAKAFSASTIVTTIRATMAETGATLPVVLWNLIATPIVTFFGTTLPSAITGAIASLATILGISVTSAGILVAGAAAAAIAGIVAIVLNWNEVKIFFTETVPAFFSETVVPFFESLPDKIVWVWENIKNSAIEKWNELIAFLSGLPDTIGTIVDSIAEWFSSLPEKIGYALGYALGTITAWAVDVYNYLKEKIPEIVTNVATWFSELPGKAYAAISTFISNVTQWGSDVFDAFKTKVSEIINNVVNWFSELPGKVYDVIIKIKEKITQWGTQTISFFETEVPKIVDKVIEFFGELPKKIVTVGENLVKGLWNGINNMVDWLGTNITGFVNGVIRGFKEGFDEHSPSKVAFEIGDYFTLGLANGIKNRFGDIFDDIQRFGDEIASTKFDFPTIDVSVDTSKYKFNPPNINAGKISGQIQEELDYMFASGSFIDYDRLGEAVYRAQSQAMKENPVQIGDKDVFSAAQRQQRREYRRTFKTGWAGID